jgi:hypothetical protein
MIQSDLKTVSRTPCHGSKTGKRQAPPETLHSSNTDV